MKKAIIEMNNEKGCSMRIELTEEYFEDLGYNKLSYSYLSTTMNYMDFPFGFNIHDIVSINFQ